MIKRWVTQVGNCEFVHKSMKDAISYGNEKITVIEMVDIDSFDEYAEALKNEKKDNVYLQAYRAGWNDAIRELLRETVSKAHKMEKA